MREAILLVSHGSSMLSADQSGTDLIYQDLVHDNPDRKVYQAYTAPKTIARLNAMREEGRLDAKTPVSSIEEAMDQIISDGAEILYVVETFLVPGLKYKNMRKKLEEYQDSFRRMYVTSPVLNRSEDCDELADLLIEFMDLDKETEHVFIAHGAPREAEANGRLEEMNDAFDAMGYGNLHVVLVRNGTFGLRDLAEDIAREHKEAKVIVHPFMLIAGRHLLKDICGGPDSAEAILNSYGFDVTVDKAGLAEHAPFRNIYYMKLFEKMQQHAKWEEKNL